MRSFESWERMSHAACIGVKVEPRLCVQGASDLFATSESDVSIHRASFRLWVPGWDLWELSQD